MENSIQENTFVFMMIIGILIMLALALAFVMFFNFSQKKLLQEQMRNQKLAFNHQEQLLHSTILVQEKERKRIARELHDEIGSKLNVILLNTHRLKKYHSEDNELADISKEIKSVIHTTIDSTRRISHDLLPPTLEGFGLIEAIKELRDSFVRTDSVDINFDVVENEDKIKDSLVELNLFRVLQEMINNSIKHGEASQISIQLWLNKDKVKLKYGDNGKGFDMSDKILRKGLGMKNIESRLNMIQSTFQYDSSPGKGFNIEIELVNLFIGRWEV